MYLILLAVLLLNGCSFSSPEQQQADKIDSQYRQLEASVKRAPSIKKLAKLRQLYAQSSFYNPYDANERRFRKAIYDDINNGEWQQCQRAAHDLLAINYTSLPGHYGAMVCAENLGDKKTSILHSSMINGLVAAIWQSGNGQTKRGAFQILSTDEAQVFLQMEGLALQNQQLLRSDARVYDLATTQAPGTGAKLKWYFDITRPWAQRPQSTDDANAQPQ